MFPEMYKKYQNDVNHLRANESKPKWVGLHQSKWDKCRDLFVGGSNTTAAATTITAITVITTATAATTTTTTTSTTTTTTMHLE